MCHGSSTGRCGQEGWLVSTDPASNLDEVLGVTLGHHPTLIPEATPVHEAARLQRDLRRAEIEPYAWVINQGLLPLTMTDLVLLGRQSYEAKFIHEVIDEHATRTALIRWQQAPPVGRAGLQELVRQPPQEQPV